MSEIPGVTTTSSPKEIGHAVAHYLSDRLPGGPWQVTAAGLRSTRDDQTTEIRLKRRRPSQTGIGAFFEPLLAVRDRSLKTWRRQHRDLASTQDDRMFESAAYALGSRWQVPAVVTTGGASWSLPGRCSIDDLASHLTVTILPVCEYLRSATGLLSLPEPWLHAGWLLQLIEFAIAQGEPEVTMPLLSRTRWLESDDFKRGQERALTGKPPEHEAASMWGYRIAMFGLHYDLGKATSER